MVKTGIATGSLFMRYFTEDALKVLDDAGVKTTEVFLESFCEYKPPFADVINSHKGDVNIHSVHVLTTQFEPQLYSVNERARKESFEILEDAMTVAEKIGAKYYTFHGPARLKKLPIVLNYDNLAKTTQEIIDLLSRHNVKLAYENVHWGYYNFIGFFEELRKRVKGLCATLDIKQARLSGLSYKDFIDEMKGDIATVHLTDVDLDGKMVLPGKGITDFYDLFSRLKDVGFDGALLLEVYSGNYKELSELMDSLYYIENVKQKVFG